MSGRVAVSKAFDVPSPRQDRVPREGRVAVREDDPPVAVSAIGGIERLRGRLEWSQTAYTTAGP